MRVRCHLSGSRRQRHALPHWVDHPIDVVEMLARIGRRGLNGRAQGYTPPSAAPAPQPGAAQTFTAQNWSSSASPGFQKRGVWFKKGDCPAGMIPTLDIGAAQFYALRRWSDGSLKTARMLARYPGFAGSESRTATLGYVSSTFSAGSTAAAGNGGLAAALTGRDVKVTFANVKQYDGTSSTTRGSGAFAASLAAHAGTATRWTLLTTGPVADVWQGWGMAADNAGGAADAHLKVNWYVTRWKAADGTTAGLQVGAVVAQDWWSVAGKYRLDYDAALVDGATTVVSYAGVQHPYQSQWLLALQGNNNAGQAPWLGGVQPTLHAVIDKAYFVSTGLVPSLNTNVTPAAVAIPSYVPCGSVEHRAAIDGTGAYLGRGIVPDCDAVAFMRGDAQAYARSRVNALAGLGVPYHYRSNRNRQRPGDSAPDTANTPIALAMAPKPASYYDFTADGMPVAVDAYFDSRSPSDHQDGLVYPQGGTGVWQTSSDASHAVSYCYFAALVTGDEWLLEAQLDLANNLAIAGIYGYHSNRQPFFTGQAQQTAAAPTSPDTGRYSALFAQYQEDNPRSLGWAQLILGHAAGSVPADHVSYRYWQAGLGHNGDYIAANLANMPSDYVAAGAYYPEGGLPGVSSPWMTGGIVTFCANTCFLVAEDPRWFRLGAFTGVWPLGQAGAGRFYMLDVYRAQDRYRAAYWTADNPLVPAVQQGFLNPVPTLTASTGTFRMNPVYWNAVNSPPPPFSNGDRIVFTKVTQNNNSGVLPAGASEGQVAYLRDVANPQATLGNGSTQPDPATTFRLAASVGGPALTWSTDCAYANMSWLPQSPVSYPVASSYPYLPLWDGYVPIHLAAIMTARQAGQPAATKTLVDATLAFVAPMRPSTYSAFDLVAA